jgi:hypothetical protein
MTQGSDPFTSPPLSSQSPKLTASTGLPLLPPRAATSAPITSTTSASTTLSGTTTSGDPCTNHGPSPVPQRSVPTLPPFRPVPTRRRLTKVTPLPQEDSGRSLEGMLVSDHRPSDALPNLPSFATLSPRDRDGDGEGPEDRGFRDDVVHLGSWGAMMPRKASRSWTHHLPPIAEADAEVRAMANRSDVPCACVRVCVCACARVRVCACVRVRVCVSSCPAQ